jgi:hypothetical protein
VVVTEVKAAKFKEAGIDDPGEHSKDKAIRVTGTVSLEEKRPRVEADDPGQMRAVEQK